MFDSTSCPVCAHHARIGKPTADVLEELIFHWLLAQRGKHPALTEMHNIHNALLNAKERAQRRQARIDSLLS